LADHADPRRPAETVEEGEEELDHVGGVAGGWELVLAVAWQVDGDQGGVAGQP
jgi:hypothetical protein